MDGEEKEGGPMGEDRRRGKTTTGVKLEDGQYPEEAGKPAATIGAGEERGDHLFGGGHVEGGGNCCGEVRRCCVAHIARGT